MTDVRWRADCARCAALCCLGLAFDRSELFAFDKPAGEPCRLLRPGHACSIHAERARRGFGGCVAYDCLGAGQRVTQELFQGRSWQREPVLVRPMIEAFWRLRQVHELSVALRLSRRLPVGPADAERRCELEHALDPAEGWSLAALGALQLEAIACQVRRWLAPWRGQLAGSGRELRRLPLAGGREEVTARGGDGERRRPRRSGDALRTPDHDVEPACEV